MSPEDDIVLRAKQLAIQVHAGMNVYDKEGVPVSAHLEEVARIVEEAGGSPAQIAAAWLHDAVEDTEVTVNEVQEKFGAEVAGLVDGLTDPRDFAQHPTVVRKQMQADRIKTMSDAVKLVKLADQTYHSRMAGSDHRSWNAKQCLEYLEGTKTVADNCRGVSASLDALFERYYENSKASLETEIQAS